MSFLQINRAGVCEKWKKFEGEEIRPNELTKFPF